MKKKAGEKEKIYLDIVKEYLDYENVYEISEIEYDRIKSLIFHATPNEHPSEFPDFIIENGFIEHFQITSSRENNKGSKAARDEAEFIRSYDTELNEKITANSNEHFLFEKGRSISGHQHDYYMESLKNNVKNHVDSLDEYTGQKECGLFMIQYFDEALNMCYVNTDGALKRDYIPYYRLSKDKKALAYLSSLEDKIKYIIFIGLMKKQVDFRRIPIYESEPFVEIIALEGLKEKIDTINDYDIYPNAVNQMSYITYV